MSVPAYILQSVSALIAGLPDSHKARVMDALKHGPRVTPEDVAEMARVHRCTVWGWVKQGKLPKPRKDSTYRRTWDYSEVSHVIY